MSETIYWIAFDFAVGGCVGCVSGILSEARNWRAKGDHEYMKTKESAGKLYLVYRRDAA